MVKLSQFRPQIEQVLKNVGVEDIQTVDLDSYWDSSLTYAENKENLLKILGKVEMTKERIRALKEQAEHQIAEHTEEHYKEETEKAEKELKEAVSRIKQGTPQLQEYFSDLIEAIKVVISGQEDLTGLIVSGVAGIGKTHTTVATLNDLGLKQKEDFEMITGYSTTVELVNLLYHYKDFKVVIIDDCLNVFRDEKAISILKSALWGISTKKEHKRIIQYNTTSSKLEAPNSFQLKAKIIFIGNSLGNANNVEIASLHDRCITLNLDFNYSTIMKMMYEFVKTESCLPKKEAEQVVDWIKETTNEATPNLNFRTLKKVLAIRKANPKAWEKIAIKQLEIDEEKAFVIKAFKEAIHDNHKVVGQVTQFCRTTHKSRATFFRYKKNFGIKRI